MDAPVAILQCPICGACYRREEESESVANGPSDTSRVVSRLGPAEGAAVVLEIGAKLRAAQASYDASCARNIALLRASPRDPAVFRRVAESLCYGNPHLRFTQELDVLLEALATHDHQARLCPGSTLHTFLASLSRRDEARSAEMFAWVEGRDLENPPEVGWLAHQVKQQAAARGGTS